MTKIRSRDPQIEEHSRPQERRGRKEPDRETTRRRGVSAGPSRRDGSERRPGPAWSPGRRGSGLTGCSVGNDAAGGKGKSRDTVVRDSGGQGLGQLAVRGKEGLYSRSMSSIL